MPKRVLGVLGGADIGSELLKKWAQSAQILLAADSGADRLLECGVAPDVVLGDLDSISDPALACGAEIIRLSDDQDTTDCDKLLAYALNKSMLPIALTGFEGDRIEQVVGAIHSVAREGLRERVTLVSRRSLSWVLGPGEHYRKFTGERTVSLIPLTVCEKLGTRGLKWQPPAILEPGASMSLSNLSESGEFLVSLSQGLVLLVVSFAPEEMPLW